MDTFSQDKLSWNSSKKFWTQIFLDSTWFWTENLFDPKSTLEWSFTLALAQLVY